MKKKTTKNIMNMTSEELQDSMMDCYQHGTVKFTANTGKTLSPKFMGFRADESNVKPSTRHSLMVRQAIDTVVSGGTTRHSAQAQILPLVLNALESRGVPYTLTALPNVGYQLKGQPDQRLSTVYGHSPAMDTLPFMREFKHEPEGMWEAQDSQMTKRFNEAQRREALRQYGDEPTYDYRRGWPLGWIEVAVALLAAMGIGGALMGALDGIASWWVK